MMPALFATGSNTLRHLGLLAVSVGLLLCAGPLRADGSMSFTLHLKDSSPVQVSLADLEDMPLTDFVTSTVWTEGVDHYSGILLRDLLLHHGIRPDSGPGRVDLVAIDGYSATIEFAQITERAPMLAFLRNGAPMPLRNQGPFWLIFPYDDTPAFRTESIYALSVWQVQTVSVIQP